LENIPESFVMEEVDYNALKKTIENNEQLESFTVLANVLEAIVEDVYKSCLGDDLGFITESIKYQKNIYRSASLLYESMQSEDEEKSAVTRNLEQFNESLEEYYAFVRASEKEAPKACTEKN
jgi:hypothetical protein